MAMASAVPRVGIEAVICEGLGALISVERHVRCEVKALNGNPVVATVRQRLKYFLAIELPIWRQIHQFDIIAIALTPRAAVSKDQPTARVALEST